MSIPSEAWIAQDEPASHGAAPGRPTLTPAAILARAADVIECNGLAHGTFHRRQHGLKARNAPVCTLGAIAIAVGAQPYAWGEAHLWKRELAVATVAIDALLDFLGFDPEETRHETLSSWNDARSAIDVMQGLRTAAREIAHHEATTNRPPALSPTAQPKRRSGRR